MKTMNLYFIPLLNDGGTAVRTDIHGGMVNAEKCLEDLAEVKTINCYICDEALARNNGMAANASIDILDRVSRIEDYLEKRDVEPLERYTAHVESFVKHNKRAQQCKMGAYVVSLLVMGGSPMVAGISPLLAIFTLLGGASTLTGEIITDQKHNTAPLDRSSLRDRIKAGEDELNGLQKQYTAKKYRMLDLLEAAVDNIKTCGVEFVPKYSHEATRLFNATALNVIRGMPFDRAAQSAFSEKIMQYYREFRKAEREPLTRGGIIS